MVLCVAVDVIVCVVRASNAVVLVTVAVKMSSKDEQKGVATGRDCKANMTGSWETHCKSNWRLTGVASTAMVTVATRTVIKRANILEKKKRV